MGGAEQFDASVKESQERSASVDLNGGANGGGGKADGGTPHCRACNKSYASQNAMEQHLKSKKHLAKAKDMTGDVVVMKKPSVVEQADQEEEEEKTMDQLVEEKIKKGRRLGALECAFCGDTSATTPEENAAHGLSAHGFFIPDVEYLVDLEGMLAYIGDKIGVGHCCLYCHRIFATIGACRDHMASMSHCKIVYDEAEDEWDDFYDFSSAPVPEELTLSPDGNQLMVGDGKVLGHRDFRVYYAQRVSNNTMTQVAKLQEGPSRERAARLKLIYARMITDGQPRNRLAPETAQARAERARMHKEQRKKDLKVGQTNELMNGKYFRRRDIHW